MGLGLTKFRLDEEIKALAPTGGSGLPSGPAGGALSGAYPNPGLASGVATGSALGADVLTTSTLHAGDVAGLWNALLIGTGAVTSAKLADGAATGTKLGADVAKLVGGLVPALNLGAGTADVSHVLSGAGTWITPPGGAPSGAAGGSLAGSYPNPTLANGVATGAVLGTDVVVTGQANLANGYAKPDTGNLLLAGMLGTGTPSSSTYLRGDRTWATGTTSPLSGLSDVSLASPAAGDTLTYDGTLTKWKNYHVEYNVLSFAGVKGDGTTDDGPAVNTALAAIYAAHGSGDPTQPGCTIRWPADHTYAIATPVTLYPRMVHKGDMTRMVLKANTDFFKSVNFGDVFSCGASSTTTVINLPSTYAPATNSLVGKNLIAMAGGANAQTTSRAISANTTTTITVAAFTSTPGTGDWFNVDGNSGTDSNDGAYNAGLISFILDATAQRALNSGPFMGLRIFGAGNILHDIKGHDVALWTEWSPTSYTQLFNLYFNPSTRASGSGSTPPTGSHLLGYGAIANDYDNIHLESLNINNATQLISPHYTNTVNDYPSVGNTFAALWTNLGPGDSFCGKVEIESTSGLVIEGLYLGEAKSSGSTAFRGGPIMISQNFTWGLDCWSGQVGLTDVDISGMSKGCILLRGNGANKIKGRVGRCQAHATPPVFGTAAVGVQFDNGSNLNDVDVDFSGYQGIGAGNFYFCFNGTNGIESKINATLYNQHDAHTVATQETAWVGTIDPGSRIHFINAEGSVHIPGTGTWPQATNGGSAYPINYIQEPTGGNTGSSAGTINAGAIATGATLTPVGSCDISVAPSAAVTGIIMAAGTFKGQEVSVFNNSANSVTFAAVATSRVADGASCVIAANTMKTFRWDGSVSSLWFHS